jgi:hypothetical protein
MTPDRDITSLRDAGRVAGWRRAAPWRMRSFVPWLRVVLGALAVLFGTRAVSVRAASEGDKASTTEVPSSWQAFAARLQRQFQERLSSDEQHAARLRDSMMKRAQAKGAAPALVLRVWMLTDGKVSRVELEGSQENNASRELDAVLIGETIGAVPPDMPQPLRLRLSLGPKARPEN